MSLSNAYYQHVISDEIRVRLIGTEGTLPGYLCMLFYQVRAILKRRPNHLIWPYILQFNINYGFYCTEYRYLGLHIPI